MGFKFIMPHGKNDFLLYGKQAVSVQYHQAEAAPSSECKAFSIRLDPNEWKLIRPLEKE